MLPSALFLCNKMYAMSAARTAQNILRAFGFVLLAATIGACSPSEDRRAELAKIHEKQAKTYLNSGQYRAAIIEARNVIQKTPTDTSGYVLLATILAELGQHKNALSVLEQAPGGENNQAFTALKIESLLGRGKFSSALDALEDPANAALANSDQGMYFRARSLAGLERPDEAIATLKKLLAKAPDDVDALVALADISISSGDIKNGKMFLQQAQALAPKHIDANMLSAKISINAGDYATA
ncbi:MAG: tetratricopeptide repeat protein, partial [Pseudomonadales bacterium]|nr:tetratricopeptide repeat protein [Pseudomonadales bacterium]